ncbi:MAG: hypothetical protein GY715_04245, partial [Planctomycetes bacterium]|nr:hypothetical protein [Planctomycetota bacterium]
TCIFTLAEDCAQQAGVFQGAGTVCDAGACPEPGGVLAEGKISQSSGGFGGILTDFGDFGRAFAGLGDLDGDGPSVGCVAIGAPAPPIPGDGSLFIEGVVWITFLNADGTVESESAIGAFAGGFGGDIVDDDQFGAGIAAIGDVNGDGVTDLAVGAPGDDDDDGGGGFNDDGAVYILFMNTDGTIQSSQKISDTAGGFTGGLNPFDRFGTSVTALGDLDGDAIPDIAVGAPGDVDPGEGSDVGAVWILLLNGDEGIEGTVKSQVKISAANPFLTGELEDFDRFGTSVTALGDLNDDGVVDLAVGAPGDDDGGPSRGAIYIVLLNVDGSVAAIQKISDTAGGLVSGLDDVDLFGASVAALGDLDGDGLPDVAVGAPLDDDAEAGGGGPLPDTNRGAVYIVLLNADGTVRGDRKVSDTIGEFDGVLADFDEFGAGLGAIGDLDGDGVTELAVGAPGDDDGGTNRGATWILFLDGDSPINFAEPQEFDAAGPPNVAAVGDLDSPIVQLPGFFGDLAAGGTLPADTEDVAVIIPNPAGGNGVVQIFLNEGTETDGTWREFEDPALTYFVGPDPSDITLGLFNGDGYLDIAVTNAGNDTVSILFNDANGMGTFTLEQTITGFQNPSAILAGEFLGVENALAVDLVVANEDADNIVFIENDGTGNFVQTEIPPVGVGIGPKAIDPLDIDNDTDEDVVVGNGASASVTIIVNEDDSDDFSVVAEVPTGEGPTDLATGDLDGDGDDDIVSSNSKDGTATVIKNNG